MGNDRSPGSQHNIWRHHILECSEAGNSELNTVTENEFKHSGFYASSGYLQVLKDLNKTCRGNLVKLYFSDTQGQLTL